MSAESNLSRKVDLFHLPPEAGDDKTLKPKAESRIRSIVDEFKADVADAQKRLSEDIRRSAGYLVPEGDQPALLSRATAILERYAVVDTLAIHYRDLTHLALRRMLMVIFFAMLVFEFFAHIVPELVPIGGWYRMIVWLYPIFWLWAFLLWYVAHRRQYQKKYHDYRALAEGLRVQFFWHLLELPDPVEKYYLHKQEGELDWIRRALRLWRESDEKTIQDAGMTGDRRTAHKDLAYRLWVQAQLKYFKSNAGPREKGRSDTCKRWGTGLFWASLALSLVLAFSEVRYVMNVPSDPHLGLPHEESVLIFFIATLLTAAALVIAYGEKMAFLEHVRQYDVASKRFADSERKLSLDRLTQTEIKDELKDLGKDALQENGDWLLLHRDRPLEVIVP